MGNSICEPLLLWTRSVCSVDGTLRYLDLYWLIPKNIHTLPRMTTEWYLPSPMKSKIRVVMIDPHHLGKLTVNTGNMHTPWKHFLPRRHFSQLQRTRQRSNISCVSSYYNLLGLKIIVKCSVTEYFLLIVIRTFHLEESFSDTKLL